MNTHAVCCKNINLTIETDNVIQKFLKVVQFLIKYKAPITKQTVKFCIDHYLYEIIPLLGHDYITEPIYHTQMDSTLVAVIRPLLNDNRYVKTCTVTGHKPDPDVFNYNIMG